MTQLTRRNALRLGVLGAALIGTSTGAAQLATARPVPIDDLDFTETYLGRRISGKAGPLGLGTASRVYVDGIELHLMRMGTGYTTQLNHYQVFGTPRLAARAAVSNLGRAQVLPFHS